MGFQRRRRKNLAFASPAAANAANRLGGRYQSLWGQGIGIGERRLFATHCPDAHPLLDRKATGFDDPLFKAPALATGVLKIKIGIIDSMGKYFAQRRRQVTLRKPPGL